jgi:hypothetical protein
MCNNAETCSDRKIIYVKLPLATEFLLWLLLFMMKTLKIFDEILKTVKFSVHTPMKNRGGVDV